ncbi:DUF4450 domain-containing protein [Sphingobacterium griseoflavum]|uniref:Glycogen debranching protein n=1 Tax=Sphingobacterium griseoflavum TaxID=1474952 RepID=A0ABQ3I2M0_9SPHI|nr:DUF4450 domain-containing protein [Sphingobacterium griseoflavum]GHE48235.1 hypothetical protein GCM10017764_34150 [Sphingobacterium griseoflavum]
MVYKLLIAALAWSALVQGHCHAQSKHGEKQLRNLHYTADQGDFLLVDGRYRFNRALYGDHRASRVEAGDLPEFALYLPGMGGNLQFVIARNGRYKKLIDADRIETRYRAGKMTYRIHDELLGGGSLNLTLLAQYAAEGLVLEMSGDRVDPKTLLYSIYGGASGKTFSRNGDIGADPESNFYLLPAYATGNIFDVKKTGFSLRYTGKRNEEQFVHGDFGGAVNVVLTDAEVLEQLHDLERHKPAASPIICAKYEAFSEPVYIQVAKGRGQGSRATNDELAVLFKEADHARRALANRIKLRTPDAHINNVGETLALAADAIWESPSYLHGAVAWRMRLNAWRGAYSADALGWHDRAREHFSAYLRSQVLEPATGPVVMDTTLHLARHIEEMGTSVFSSGYVSRNPNNNRVPHHYDMNLVFFDQLFSHFDHTGDKAYLKEAWPSILRHLAWEKRNFDTNNDGLYDAYCAIWASDGLQYSGGGVAHSSAYNYRANRAAAALAGILGIDAQPFTAEADKIAKALKTRLWIADKGHFAEFEDLLGNRLRHDSPGLWTIYHIADAFLLDDFESYQNTQYIHNHLPHIPIQVKEQTESHLYTLATSRWQPYTWSINNVALAENLQAALAFWQSGRQEDAYLLWKSNLIESMYHGVSPGNFQQLSHYDAFRGELYRDFADPIGVASRTLVEGLFGVVPRLMQQEIHVRPGFPRSWNFAEIDLPQWQYKYRKTDRGMHFDIRTQFKQKLKLKMELPISFKHVKSVTVNGEDVLWKLKSTAVNGPVILFETAASYNFQVDIDGEGTLDPAETVVFEHPYHEGFILPLGEGEHMGEIHDPQQLVRAHRGNRFQMQPECRKGTFFVHIKAGQMSFWRAVDISLVAPVQHHFLTTDKKQQLHLKNNGVAACNVLLTAPTFQREIALPPGGEGLLEIPADMLSKGTNDFALSVGEIKWKISTTIWELPHQQHYIQQDLSGFYNARVNQIFQQHYLSPRPVGPTLQLPWQGIGNWCYPLTMAQIDDQGLMDARKDEVATYLGIPFLIKGAQHNIIFASQWDNYPTQLDIPLSGRAAKLYVLMAGSTNPMQSQIVNGKIRVQYKDGHESILELHNPSNWWPIEQDYFNDQYAFDLPDDQIPYRVKLKTGELYRGGSLSRYDDIKGYTSRAVDGGSATILDLPLDPSKELKSLSLVSEANDVVIGIMAATLLKANGQQPINK